MGNVPISPANSQPAADLLVLHAVRVIGFADTDIVAQRSGIDQDTVSELLADDEAYGWVTRNEFAGTGGWSITELGKAEDSRRLTAELAHTTASEVVERAHYAFEPLNTRLVRACTDWQLRPQDGDRLATNDHMDPTWDGRVLDELAAVADELARVVDELVDSLPRFGGYRDRFAAALAHARTGRVEWVAGVGVASCHAVWMELHEDLLSTLGISRGTGSARE